MEALIRNNRLHYLDQGTGLPVLWVHGYPLSSAIFHPQLAIRNVRHLMPDLRGFGRSQEPEREFSIEDHAADMLALLDHLEIERAVVAGLSMGGYIVLNMIRLAPERFTGLILIDTRSIPDTEEGKAKRLQTIDLVEREGTSAVIHSMLPNLLHHPHSEAGNAARRVMEAASPRGVVEALRAMADRSDSTPTLRKIAVPTLVVVGEQDGITPPEDARQMVDAIPHAVLSTIADAGHLSNLETPIAFNQAVERFLEPLRSEPS